MTPHELRRWRSTTTAIQLLGVLLVVAVCCDAADDPSKPGVLADDRPAAAGQDADGFLVDDSDDGRVDQTSGELRGLPLIVVDGDGDADRNQQDAAKRARYFGAFRSDLGKRNMLDDEDEDVDATKRAYSSYRQRGKTFKADLGKRFRTATGMFRSDLGRRSVPVAAEMDELLRNNGGYADEDDDQLVAAPVDGELSAVEAGDRHDVQRRRSMFRSDLGKRAASKFDYGRRMFRADLGKRRMFRHDLG